MKGIFFRIILLFITLLCIGLTIEVKSFDAITFSIGVTSLLCFFVDAYTCDMNEFTEHYYPGYGVISQWMHPKERMKK
jgi:hypothetical protein